MFLQLPCPFNSENVYSLIFALEKRLTRESFLYDDYSECMHKYLENGHMTLLIKKSIAQHSYYKPYHYIFNPNSFTRKLRVVFDVSASSDVNSLNSPLLMGPILQRDLGIILLNVRRHLVVADIKQI